MTDPYRTNVIPCVCHELRPNASGPPFTCDKHQTGCCNWCGKIVPLLHGGFGDDGCDHENEDWPYYDDVKEPLP